MINADGSETSSERLAWKEAVLAAIEGAYPSQTASNPVPPSPVSVVGLSAGAGAADHAGALKTVDDWLTERDELLVKVTEHQGELRKALFRRGGEAQDREFGVEEGSRRSH